MKKSKTKASRLSKKQIVLFALISVAVVLVGWWSWNQFAPRPLGNDLTYIGKKDFGGWFMKPSSNYYYSTNISPEQIKVHFSNANLSPSSKEIDSLGPNYTSKGFVFISSSGDKFIVTYYSDATTVIEAFGLRPSSHQYIVSVTSVDYDTARKSL